MKGSLQVAQITSLHRLTYPSDRAQELYGALSHDPFPIKERRDYRRGREGIMHGFIELIHKSKGIELILQ